MAVYVEVLQKTGVGAMRLPIDVIETDWIT
jgi:hypothetical protein